MLIDAVRACLTRDLEGLAAELGGYPDDAAVWADVPGFANSTGTLVLHCCGNLRHFIGAVLGGSGYVRIREEEFSARGQSRTELQLLLAITGDEVVRALEVMDRTTLGDEYPAVVGGGHLATDQMLIHLVSHLAYHLGQADGHRRVVTGERRSVGALGVGPLIAAS